MTKKIFIQICCCSALLALTACNDHDEPGGAAESYGNINVGGTSMGDVITTASSRADDNVVDAETLDWFKEVLVKGLDITYSNSYDSETGVMTEGKEKTAKLTYHEDTKKYTFLYTDNNQPAEWMGNGYHAFEGVYIPSKLYGNEISSTLIKVFEDQTNDGNTNYDILSQYTCMPLFPQSRIAATVNQISLPFQHRLARIIVQVVIDDDIKKDYNDPASPKAAILGYDNTDEHGGGKNCSLRFCGVKVLGLVDESTNKPTWFYDPEIKLAPHFLEERPEVKVTQKDEEGNILYDENDNPIVDTYENVPTFDVIVRPTYFERTAVMPDERTGSDVDNQKILDMTNSISFNVTLDNGMVYTKDVTFDLNPNEQTTITLHITREGINVNDAGTNNWIETKSSDGYYGIDNTGGHNLSDAGSCWQRAYQISTDNYDVTDGSNPKGPESTDQNTQYLTKEQFIEALKEAKEGGKHHGDYFILTGDLTLDDWTPFEFTGHLDGRHHKITLPAGTTSLFSALNGNYTGAVGTANINSDNSPMPGYRGEILNLYLTNTNANLVSGQNTGYIYNCHITGSGHFCEENAEGNTTGQVVDCTTK